MYIFHSGIRQGGVDVHHRLYLIPVRPDRDCTLQSLRGVVQPDYTSITLGRLGVHRRGRANQTSASFALAMTTNCKATSASSSSLSLPTSTKLYASHTPAQDELYTLKWQTRSLQSQWPTSPPA